MTLTRNEVNFLFVTILMMLTGLLIWSWAMSSSASVVEESEDWPQVTRTIDGTPVVVMPEDLDR